MHSLKERYVFVPLLSEEGELGIPSSISPTIVQAGRPALSAEPSALPTEPNRTPPATIADTDVALS